MYSAASTPQTQKCFFSLILSGSVCDEPAEGKRKGRPKAEVQELRSIPVSESSLNWSRVFDMGFFF